MLIGLGDAFLLIAPEIYSRENFLDSFKVRSGSWGEHFANRLFSCLFGNTTNLLEEYKLFYMDEYPDFNTFLVRSYGFDNKIIKIIDKNLRPDYVILYGGYRSEGDYNMSQLIEFNDEIVDTINEVLTQGVKDENQI